jgi:sugar phosphate isomerase/epimerase
MRAPGGAPAHLTYCTNIHPGESWAEVRANLERYLVPIRQRVAPARQFGVGLRLSARAAAELSAPAALAELRDFLDEHALYVFTINGFPYGDFHGTHVKENVYRPDWLEEPRLEYSNVLAELLCELLPEEGDSYGSVSTVPVAWRARASGGAADDAVALLMRHVAHLAELRASTGKLVVLALEPEPECMLETSAHAAAFFEQRLLGRDALAGLAALLGESRAAAEDTVRRHLGVCLDACHAAVEFENADNAVDTILGAGVRIAKIQVSAGLRIAAPDAEALARLRAYDDGVYLHQVVVRRGDELVRFPDLPAALDAAAGTPNAGDEWRVHFHVPLHRERLGNFDGTQPFLRALLARQRRAWVSGHLEVETYTWGVLPPEHRGAGVVEDVARELEWVLGELTS